MCSRKNTSGRPVPKEVAPPEELHRQVAKKAMPLTIRLNRKEPRVRRKNTFSSSTSPQMAKEIRPTARNRAYMAATDRIRNRAWVKATK